jgi:2-phosphosulfolactate phosphatase
MELEPGHRQEGYAIRCEWGPTGARAVAADHAVVVDVLSFSTTVVCAVERGASVHPQRWRDDRAAACAGELGARLAVGRLEAREQAGEISLSPGSMTALQPGERVVLPSPNGSTISHVLLSSGATVVAGSLRNATAVAEWLAPRLAEGATLVVVAAGERWPDGTLRPAAEDLWGAGAILNALVERGVTGLSPEARLAAAAYAEVAPRISEELQACASGVELIERGFGSDVEIAAGADESPVVPVLVDGAFVGVLSR